MSPTATPPPNSREGIEAVRDAMISSGFTTSDTFEGCSQDEINAVIEAAGSVELPGDYLAFLQVFGRHAGTLFRGSHVCYPEPLTARDAAVDVASDPEETLTLENRFFFGHHQGYEVYFFEHASDAVYSYVEGHPFDQKLADNFTQWLWDVFHRTKELRDRSEQLRQDTERKRAQMRAEGAL
ncbi:hypothetical protein ABIA39_009114 [Nocardia sp. GAS34]|uniref:SMI1/KNR4 family protein n=1 Tax=unclassified Nocardia TaxID=2637762 RepID=UPI003D241240